MATPKLRNLSGFSDNSNGTFSWPYRVQPGRNRALYLGVIYRSSSLTVSATFNGDSFTEVSTEQGGGSANNGRRMRVFRLLSPDVGEYTMSVTRSDDTRLCHAFLVDLTDVDQTTPEGTIATLTNSGTTTASSIDVSAAVGDLVLDFFVSSPVATADDGRTVIPFGATVSGFLGSKVADATTETCAWSYASTALNTGQIGFAVKGDDTGTEPPLADRTGSKRNKSITAACLLGSGESVSSGSTVYIPLASLFESAGGLSLGLRTAWTEPGDITWRIRVSANAASSSSTFTVMEDGSATGTTASVGAGVTGDIVLGPHAADGTTDLAVRFENGGGGTITLVSATIEFAPTDLDTTLSFLSVYSAGSTIAGSDYDKYFPISGPRGAADTSGPVPWPTDGDLTELGLYQVSGPTRDYASEFRTYVNGAPGNNVLTWTGSDQTSKVDTTHSDALTYNDTVETRFTNGAGTGSFEIERMSATFRAANGHFVLASASRSASGSGLTGNTSPRYMMPGGAISLLATESDAQFEMPFDATLCRMIVSLESNSFTLTAGQGDASVVLRVNGADTDLKVNILRGVAGSYYDVLSTVEVEAGDDISIAVRAPGSGTSGMQLRGVMIVGVSAGAGGVDDLEIDDAMHVHSSDGLQLTQAHVLASADSAHAHAADALVLTQAHQLAVADATHDHGADNVTLSTESALAIAGALHGHTTDGVVLTQQHVLAVVDALHAHAAESLVLESGDTLAIVGAVHAHLADSLQLTQAHVLAIMEAMHSHYADNVAFVGAAAALVRALVRAVSANVCTVSATPTYRCMVSASVLQ